VSNSSLGIDISKLPLETLYKTMEILHRLHPETLGDCVPLWNVKTWKEVQRRSKLPDADCDHCEHSWSGENRARWENRFLEAREIDSWHCFMFREWPGPKCELFQRNRGEVR